MAIKSGSHAIDPSNGTLMIYTYRDGMGAKLAHDLVIRATRWGGTLNIDSDNPSASNGTVKVDARSLEIVEARGGVKPLSDKDKRDIAKNIDEKVLMTGRFPELTFTTTGVSGSPGQATVNGNLTIMGNARPVQVGVTVDGGQLRATAKIRQSDYGIKPFSAMLGAIKLRDDVDFELTVNLPTA